MTTVDLGVPTPAASEHASADAWAGVPRRIGLSIAELTHACGMIGAPLPFETVSAQPGSGLEGRLGATRATAEAEAFERAVAALGDPAVSLERRALVTDGALDAGIAGALGVLTSPEIVLDIDVTIDDLRGHSWHRQRGDAVAALSTVDGLIFELSWFPTGGWAAEIARAGALPDDCELRDSDVPDHLEVPFELADSVFEALRTGRTELVPVLTGGDTTLETVLTALSREARGRLRAVVGVLPTDGAVDERSPLGVVSWTLVNDGWRAFRPRTTDGHVQLNVTSVEPRELAAELAPILAEVSR